MNDGGDQRGDNVGDQRGDDRAECSADHNGNGEIHDIAAKDEVSKTF